MRKILFVMFLPVAALCILSWMSKSARKKETRKYKVTGSIMQTVSYCDGARPSPEILEKGRTPAGIPFGKLYIKKGVFNDEEGRIVYTIHADANGNFSISLPSGNYCLVEEWKSKPFILPLNNKNQTVDSICYRKLYDSCDYQLNITDKNIVGMRFIFHRPCFYNKPCISFKGPLPHAAVSRLTEK